jgi:hypothetical protein
VRREFPPEELEPAFATLVGERVGALVVSGETLFLTQRDRVVWLAPVTCCQPYYLYREFFLARGLMSYGTYYSEEFHKLELSLVAFSKAKRLLICGFSK